MEDEVEDIIGDVKYTNSQKSVATSNIYSLDFTDSSSDKTSVPDTYVIDRDDSDSSEKTFQMHDCQSIISFKDKTTPVVIKQHMVLKHKPFEGVDRSVGSSQHCSVMAEEIFTQTSKTIFELAQNDSTVHKKFETLETQTSLFSITENRTVEYHIKLLNTNNSNTAIGNVKEYENNNNRIMAGSLEDKSSICRELDNEIEINANNILSYNPNDDFIKFIDDESEENVATELNLIQYDISDFETSKHDTDMDEDSLVNTTNEYCEVNIDSHEITSDTSDVPKSIDNEIEELYHRISDNFNHLSVQHVSVDPESQNFNILTPLTEETTLKNSSIVDLTPSIKTLSRSLKDFDRNSLDKHNKSRAEPHSPNNERDGLKLPSIQKNASCPNSLLNFLFTLNIPKKICKTNTLPLLFEDQKDAMFDRWGDASKDLASGESPYISGENDSLLERKHIIHLPPIHIEGALNGKRDSGRRLEKTEDVNNEAISISDKIKELKSQTGSSNRIPPRRTRLETRSPSPISICSPDRSELCDAAEKGCEALCAELLRRLRLTLWCDVMETLNEIPKALEKFWSVITENRTADLIRQVSVHVESPRSQLARTACSTLAEILKNTNYTKKPDFYEAIAILLIKTGSYSRPVRRAANVALDNIVCSVDATHSLTAICICGTSHKSALVRCASARLLVVCCALAEGGRLLLRGRPQTAAMARRYVLRSLSELLYDKNTDTRKYAERLYAMLRPLSNFEAYFLTDVDVELATKQMKKYDQALAVPKENDRGCSTSKKREQDILNQKRRDQYLAKYRSRDDLCVQRSCDQDLQRHNSREQNVFKQKAG